MSQTSTLEHFADSTLEQDITPPYMFLGDAAEGIIGGTHETHPRIDELTQRLADGEFHVKTELKLPCGCIDGRCGCWARPDAAGGTLTLAVADDLLAQKYAGDGSTAGMVRNVIRSLRERDLPAGGHNDDHANGEASGCGANDRLGLIYDLMKRKADVLRDLSGVLGLSVSDEDHEAITAGAARRDNFSTGRDVLDVLRDESPEQNIDTLIGAHKEVVAVINLRQGTTLDRDAVAAEFGNDYQAFNVDVWSFENAARELYPAADETTIKRAVIAMVYYNIATALTLCGPNMRVVLLE